MKLFDAIQCKCGTLLRKLEIDLLGFSRAFLTCLQIKGENKKVDELRLIELLKKEIKNY